jgi:cell division transport system ATP-binding protein
MEKTLINYWNVDIDQQESSVLKGVNLKVYKGDFIYIIGKVGSGKTSLLKTIYGELKVTGDCANVLGYDMEKLKRKNIPRLRRKLGIVFQDFQLLTDRTIYDNLEFVLRAIGWKKKSEMNSRIEKVLEQVGMSDKSYKIPNELSGGEQQRIVIARAILNSPQIILADEPTGNLDAETGLAIGELLYNISLSETGTSVIITTHNAQLIEKIPGKVYRCDENSRLVNATEEFS